MKHLVLVGLTWAALSIPGAAVGQETIEIPPEFMEALKADVSTVHMDVMQASIMLQPGQAGTFWGIYDEYLKELGTITEGRATLLKDFAQAFQTMTDEEATDLGGRALDLRAETLQLRRRYFERIAGEVSGKAAGQFLQIENQLQTILDLGVALEVPIIGG